MSFKCSVFGHAYGDSKIEREREEEGSEVVTTIRELQSCKRCGETRVVSENKEVTTMETAADIVAEDLEDDSAEASEPTSPTDDPDSTAPAEGSEPTAPADGTDPTAPAAGTETAASAEATTERTDTGDVTSPRESQAQGSPAGSISDAETGEDLATSPESADETDPETDDGVILDEEPEPAEPEREPGEWPDEPDDDDDEWRPETDIDPTPEESRTIEPTASAVTVPEGEFHCPECEFTTPVEQSSLRQGDFCPECHRGALEHVTE